jgi:hypothetical protein
MAETKIGIAAVSVAGPFPFGVDPNQLRDTKDADQLAVDFGMDRKSGAVRLVIPIGGVAVDLDLAVVSTQADLAPRRDALPRRGFCFGARRARDPKMNGDRPTAPR